MTRPPAANPANSSASPHPPEQDPAAAWLVDRLDRELLTPMMQHYASLKDQYPQALLFYRLGDFYETFFADAHLVARELELVLTGRDGGKLGRIPMAGVPHHALDRYATQLVAKGYAIAICEQMEAADQSKGLVRREVTRVLTPGTLLEEGMLAAKQNNYLAAVVLAGRTLGDEWGLAYTDISTGEFWVTQQANLVNLQQELLRLQPAEILLPVEALPGLGLLRPGAGAAPPLPADLPRQFCYTLRPEAPFQLGEARAELLVSFRVRSLEGFGCGHLPLAVRAAGGLMHYLGETRRDVELPLDRIQTYTLSQFLTLDHQTRRNLELVQTVRDGTLSGSLLWALDRTRTAMGGRMLRRWLQQPLLELAEIRQRQGAIAQLVQDGQRRTALQHLLSQMYDLERLAGRAGSGTANARDLVGLAHSLETLPAFLPDLEGLDSPLFRPLQTVDPDLTALGVTLRQTLVEHPPLTLTEGGLIQSGVNADLDQLRQQVSDDHQWIATLEATERERTGITTLKVGFTKAFGYYLSISRAKASQVPPDYLRKQTLVNEERYITPELKEREARILTAQTDLHQQEYEIFLELRAKAGVFAPQVRAVAQAIATLDILAGLAEIAVYHQYTCPTITTDRCLQLTGARHPVVEQALPAGLFVANGVSLGRPGDEPPETQSSETQSLEKPPQADLMILTGPNMSGKSTYLRQIGLIQVMAQMGSFVPAQTATLSLCDRIFTRVGAVDDLATGQSTFMVEMNETANILNHATPHSLVLLDEIGRGTATFDGLSIAWAVAEYLATELRPRTIFATHYHELNELAALLPNVINCQVKVKESKNEIIFLHQVEPGGANRSYGIEVGRLAGLPTPVIRRAQQVLRQVSRHSHIAVGLRQGHRAQKDPHSAPSAPQQGELPIL